VFYELERSKRLNLCLLDFDLIVVDWSINKAESIIFPSRGSGDPFLKRPGREAPTLANQNFW
jgi:hypothetical protein